ncbi:DUF3208 domain-containing protein [Deinococcus peraridilitoris]|uniref:DUF3208 domain-containing protein n=1 Tax=Deinococcus peraridilitoris (strain DSM 19664 / LMG 22246 / CIP 109416 / KR-200) TaxID=937777 RepID=L0A6T9_DEIPD|nr:DUF3208 domain-containing protein [Deinococcus peraridilitoris]AFZ68907.1 Protein of unknown function (DUF3208) [Deinococcus peraridilitoris DSM 19664]
MTESEELQPIRLLQGYLWHPRDAGIELSGYLPQELSGARLVWDEVTPPFAFFENGELTSSQVFYQFTTFRVYERRPDNDTLHAHAQGLSEALGPLLERTPPGVGWQLWEDLREL